MAFKGFKFCHLHIHAEMLDLPVGTESKIGSLSNTISKDEKSSGDRVEDIQNILQEYVIYVVCSEQISSEQQFLMQQILSSISWWKTIGSEEKDTNKVLLMLVAWILSM